MKKFIKKVFFTPSWYHIITNPYFIARYYLAKEIRNFSKEIKNKKILDVGCGQKPYEYFFLKNDNSYVGIDTYGGGHKNDKKEADKYYDGKNIPFEENSFDVVISTQVIEHLTDPDNLIRESFRVLRDGGILFLTMPFVWPEHEKPYDFNRFTIFQHKKILEKNGFDMVSINKTCGVFAVCGQLLSDFIFEGIKYKILKMLVIILICFPVQFICLCLDLIFKKSGITLDYVVIAKKK